MHKQEVSGRIVVNYDAEGFDITVFGTLPTPREWAEIVAELITAYAKAAAHGNE